MTGFFSGTATAMITPFGADGGVNFNSFGEMIERQITAGTDMLVILGTTGEPATMTEEEKVSVMEYSVKKAKGRIKIVFGCGSNCTDHAVSAAKQAEAIGADGLLAVTPYYNKCTQNGLYAYYKSICEAVKIPVIAYNVPSRTGVNIQPATMARIAEIPNMAGIKDAGGNMSQTMEIFRSIRGKCDLYSGEDALNFPILAVGGSGVISVLSNVVPADVKKLYTLIKEGRTEEACALQDKLLPLSQACFLEVNPIPAKAAMNLLGFDAGTPRAPLSEIEPNNKEKLRKAMADYGLEIKA
jgi:dihydrodipicolinate synthase